MPDSKTLTIVAEWLDENASRLGLSQTRRNTMSNPAKLHAGYETGNFVVSVTAWEQGSCLDIDILDRVTGRIEIVAHGPCSEQSGVLERLNAFAQRLVERRSV